jgi:hypothetical protein
MEHVNYPLRVMHGYSIPTREVIEFCQYVRRTKKISTLPGIEDVARARREVLPYGALVLERLLEAMAPSEVVFSVFGIREGLLFSLMTPHEQAKDPLLCFAEDYARDRSRSVEHAHELCAWTDALFEGDGLKELPEDRRLRYAACLLSDIGWKAHPDYRGEQSLNVVAHSGLSGIDHPGRIFLALAIYYRHVGADESKADDLSQARGQQAGSEAGADHRCGDPGRPYALHRHGRRDRRNEAVLPGQQARPHHSQGLRRARRREAEAAVCSARRAVVARARDPYFGLRGPAGGPKYFSGLGLRSSRITALA